MTEQEYQRHEGWAEFIDKNSERYLQIYEANHDKKIFLHTNWAAFFFGPNWMFYRKMYGWGMIAVLLNVLIPFGTLFAMVGIYLPQLRSILSLASISPNDAFMQQVATATVDDILYGKILFVVITVTLLAQLIFSLFADCIYRQHIRKNMGIKGDGTSVGAVILAIVASGLFGELVSMVAEALIKLMLGIS